MSAICHKKRRGFGSWKKEQVWPRWKDLQESRQYKVWHLSFEVIKIIKNYLFQTCRCCDLLQCVPCSVHISLSLTRNSVYSYSPSLWFWCFQFLPLWTSSQGHSILLPASVTTVHPEQSCHHFFCSHLLKEGSSSEVSGVLFRSLPWEQQRSFRSPVASFAQLPNHGCGFSCSFVTFNLLWVAPFCSRNAGTWSQRNAQSQQHKVAECTSAGGSQTGLKSLAKDLWSRRAQPKVVFFWGRGKHLWI